MNRRIAAPNILSWMPNLFQPKLYSWSFPAWNIGDFKILVLVKLVETDGDVSTRALRIHSPNDIVALAEKVQQAHDFVQAKAISRLSVIAEQMKFLRLVWFSLLLFNMLNMQKGEWNNRWRKRLSNIWLKSFQDSK